MSKLGMWYEHVTGNSWIDSLEDGVIMLIPPEKLTADNAFQAWKIDENQHYTRLETDPETSSG